MKAIRGFYESIIHFGEALQPFVLLLFRSFWGWAFFETGFGKLHNIARTAGYFDSLGIPFSTANAYLVGSVETVGGLLLLVGLLSRPAALILAINMIVAYLTAHWDLVSQAFVNPEQLTEAPPFLFLLTSILVLAFGPGAISIDAFFKRYVFKG